MTLHIVNQSPHAGNALNDCLQAFHEGDLLLLIEDGVYAAYGTTLSRLPKQAAFCLSADAEARGIEVDPSITAIDEARWVDLCTQHNPIVSWFR